MYNVEVCICAIEAERNHAMSVIAIDNCPDRDTHMGKLTFCECSMCAPHLWPDDIEEQLDEFYEENGPGTISMDF